MLMASILASSRRASALRADRGASCSRVKQASHAVSDPAGSLNGEGRKGALWPPSERVVTQNGDGPNGSKNDPGLGRSKFSLICACAVCPEISVVGGRQPPCSPTSKSRLSHNGTSRVIQESMSLSLRLKDLLGPVTRVKKKRTIREIYILLGAHGDAVVPRRARI